MRLFVSDMDGTLLGADSRVSAGTVSILRRLTTEGVMFTVATARTPATVQPLLEGIGGDVPAVVMTGAALWNRSAQTYSGVSFIPADEYDMVMELCMRRGVHPFVYVLSPEMHLDVYHAARSLSRPEKGFVDQRRHLKLKTFHLATPAPASLGRNCSVLVFAIGPLSELRMLASEISNTASCSLSCYPDIFDPSTGYLEVFAPGVSKAAAVERLKKQTGADSLVVFGDNLNDLPMMAVADVAVAVGNALPEVKTAADVVIGPNTADSVAHYIESVVRGI